MKKPQSDKYDYMAKVVILGDSAVGKTNIMLRYTSQEYKPTHLATVVMWDLLERRSHKFQCRSSRVL
jgi:GTPase SAR1 family protein